MVNVSDEIISFCTACKIDLAHVVVAMQGDRAVKVQCKTCKGFHNYRAPKGVTTPKAKRASKAKVEKVVRTMEEEWQTLMSQNPSAPLQPYSTKASYKAGDKISHPTFGDGVVEKLIHPNKITIVFKMDSKILIHGG